jgi:rod shape-determining protein MreD
MQASPPIWRIWPLLWLLLVLQTTVLARFDFWGVHVDVVLLAVVSVALLYGMETGALFGLVAGTLSGYCAGVSIGSFVLSRLVIGAGFGLFDRRFSNDNPLAAPVCAAVATLIAQIIFGILSPGEYSLEMWLRQTAIAALAHAVFIWPVYWIFMRVVPSPRAFA